MSFQHSNYIMSFVKLFNNLSICRGISKILATKYKPSRWWSYLSKLLMESFESIKRGKKLLRSFFSYCKIPNMEHRTHQIGLFRLTKTSSQKQIKYYIFYMFFSKKCRWSFDRFLADRLYKFLICFKVYQQ